MNRIRHFISNIYSGVEKYDYDKILPCFIPQKGISRIIYQTNRTKRLPTEIEENIDNIKRINPNWQYKLYDDSDIEDYIKDNYGDIILNYYRRIDPQYGAAKADLFRYLLIYKEGGVYIDLKSSITKSLDEFLYDDDEYILSHWDNQKGDEHEGFGMNYSELQHIERGEFMQWFLIASPGHPFLRAVILQVLKNIDLYNPYKWRIGTECVFYTTGPNTYTLTIEKEMARSRHNVNSTFRWVDIFNDLGFKYSIYEKKGDNLPVHSKIFEWDYRRAWKPLIIHENKIVQIVNISIFYVFSFIIEILSKCRSKK